MAPRTLFQKVWDAHVVRAAEAEPSIVYVDLHLVHEVTSPQAFEGLRLQGRRVRAPHLAVATMDHNVPTVDQLAPIKDEVSRRQVEALAANCSEAGIACFGITSSAPSWD
jgi:3-isopropylmalate/(R)-2-methylmalate dehydratase large subunit